MRRKELYLAVRWGWGGVCCRPTALPVFILLYLKIIIPSFINQFGSRLNSLQSCSIASAYLSIHFFLLPFWVWSQLRFFNWNILILLLFIKTEIYFWLQFPSIFKYLYFYVYCNLPLILLRPPYFQPEQSSSILFLFMNHDIYLWVLIDWPSWIIIEVFYRWLEEAR